MLLLRILVFLTLVLAGLSALAYLLTRDRRYARLSWGLVKLMALVGAVFLALLVLERLVLI
jgi:heme/copper-type cytochrome/quinol oxidase subunit 2